MTSALARGGPVPRRSSHHACSKNTPRDGGEERSFIAKHRPMHLLDTTQPEQEWVLNTVERIGADTASVAVHREIGILLQNNQRQHRTLHIQDDLLPCVLC